MLKSVHLKNFKLHEDTRIEAAPITVFIGPNNSGKSSIFQALLALRQAVIRRENTFLTPASRSDTNPANPFMYPAWEVVNIGQFADVVRGGGGTLFIGVSGDLGSTRPATEVGPVQVNLEVRIRDNSLSSHVGNLRVPLGEIKWTFSSLALELTGPRDIRLTMSDPPGSVTLRPVPDFRLLYVPPDQIAAPRGDEDRRKLIDVGDALAGVAAGFLSSLHHISALRGFEEWGYPLPQERVQPLERLSLPDRAVALVTTIASNARLKKELSDRLSDLLKIGVDIEFVGGSRVMVFATQEGRDQGQRLFVNEGTGANQLPFILVPIALARKNETILLSEPEVHLHPKGQCELTRMLLTIAKRENIQFFIETHSEHVLHVILNAVARGDWAKDDVALHYFESGDGKAQVKRLGINGHGQVDGGLPGFFDQSLTELTEYLGALGKR